MSDLNFLNQVENNPDYWSFSDTPQAYSMELLIEYINQAHRSIEEVGQERFVIALTDETPVGFVDLYDFNVTHQRAGVGIIIEKEYRSMGYAKQALGLICDYASQQLSLHQLYATIIKDNHESCALFKQFGFTKTAVKKEWHHKDGIFVDEYLFQYLFEK